MPIRYEPIAAPKLDPRTEREIAEASILRTYEASDRRLNDFSPGSVLRTLVEALAFVSAELLYHINKLPLAWSIRWLQTIGIQRSLGSTASVTLTVTLTQPLSESWILPQGYAVLSRDRSRKYRTDEQLVIQPGNTVATVTATCTTGGIGGNQAKFEISQLVQSLPYLASITNLEPARGGTDAESFKQLQTRAFREVRRRGLVSASDFAEEAIKLLGPGAIALTIGGKTESGANFPGGVVVYALNPDGSTLNSAQLETLRETFQGKLVMGLTAFAANIDVVPLTIDVTARVFFGTNPDVIANRIAATLANNLTPGRLPIGRALLVDDLRHWVRLSGGVEFVETIGIARSGDVASRTLNFELPSDWSCGRLDQLRITLSDGKNTFRYTK